MSSPESALEEAPKNILDMNFDFKTGLSYFKSMPQEEVSFRYSYARIPVFLTSFARYQFAKMVLPYSESIVRILTDSIMTNAPIDGLPISQKLGEWKIEHEAVHIKILNKNKYIKI